MTNIPGQNNMPAQQNLGQWYWNGKSWDWVRITTQPMAQPMTVQVHKGVSGTEHMVHALLTLFTCGLWIPVWVIRAIVGGQSRTVNQQHY